MNRSTSEFGFRLFIFLLLHVFLTIKVIIRKLMMILDTFSGFYSGNCFYRVVVLFNSWISVYECLVRVNCPIQLFSNIPPE